MNNETYGITLEMITAPFKKQMQDTTVRIAELSSQIKTLQSEMKYTDPGSQAFSEYAIAINAAKNELKSVKDDINSSTRSMKKFLLSLFSIRRAWSLLSRASSSYISQNEELSNKIQSAWVGLGSMLAPIIEKVVDIFIKAIYYVNAFVTALTGVNLLAKASTKSVKGLANASKQLAGFDTITNLSGQSTGTSSTADWADSFKNVDVNVEWVAKIQELAQFLKDHVNEIVSGLLGIAGAVLAIKLGAEGLTSLGLFGLISGICEAMLTFKGIWENFDPNVLGNGTTFSDWGGFIQGIATAVLGLAAIITSLPLAIAGVCVLIFGTVMKYWDQIKGYLEIGFTWLGDSAKGLSDKGEIILSSLLSIAGGIVEAITHVFNGVFTGVKQVFDGIILIFKGKFKEGFVNIGKGIANAIIGIINGALSLVAGVWDAILNAVHAVGTWFGKDWKTSKAKLTARIPYLDTGTNYIPEDTLAMVHKGEAVIPKKFNSKEYFNQSGNEETNTLLKQLLTTIENKDTNVYMDSQKVGQSVTNYINSQSRIMGRSVI